LSSGVPAVADFLDNEAAMLEDKIKGKTPRYIPHVYEPFET
jgi:hypothetical protein